MIIPTRDRPRYKPVLRLRQDLWGTVLTKNLQKKKWRDLRQRLSAKQKREEFYSRPKKTLPNFHLEKLVNSRWYSPRKRYAYRDGLVKQQAFKYYYGCLQDYKVKLAVLRTRTRGWFGFAQSMESHLSMFLYKFKIVGTPGESRYHFRKNRVFVEGNSRKKNLSQGSLVGFPTYFHPFVKQGLRGLSGTSPKNKLGAFPRWVDFDPQSLRFLILKPSQPISLPFYLDFKTIWRWYRHEV